MAILSDALDLAQIPLLAAPLIVFAENTALTVLDLVTAFALSVILGKFDKMMIPIVLLEAIPVVSIFPSWTLFTVTALKYRR